MMPPVQVFCPFKPFVLSVLSLFTPIFPPFFPSFNPPLPFSSLFPLHPPLPLSLPADFSLAVAVICSEMDGSAQQSSSTPLFLMDLPAQPLESFFEPLGFSYPLCVRLMERAAGRQQLLFLECVF